MQIVSRILWCVHTGLFLFCVMRFRIPIFIIPWLLLYLIHSYRVWIKPQQTPEEKARAAFVAKVNQLGLSESESQKVLQLSDDLRERLALFAKRDIEGAISKVEQQLASESDSSLQQVLNDKKQLLESLRTEHETVRTSHRLLEERINVLDLQTLQDSQAAIEYQDIQDKLQERQAVHQIMQRLDDWE